MVVVARGDVGCLVGLDHSGHVEDFGLPVVLPAGDGPEQALISDFKSHLFSILI